MDHFPPPDLFSERVSQTHLAEGFGSAFSSEHGKSSSGGQKPCETLDCTQAGETHTMSWVRANLGWEGS